MTREEAIEYLKRSDTTVRKEIKTRTAEALEMAINALEQQPCEDAVSRQAVLDLPKIKTHNVWGNVICESVDVENVRQLPSVTPQPKMGRWIPVSERLPEEYKEVIVTDIETSDTYLSRYVGNGYWECDNGRFKNRIIAWMPLPNPYKQEVEE